MSNFVTNWHFFKNTYSEPYIVRMQFTIRVPALCSLVADNMCRCDHWFSKNGSVRIKYDIFADKNINRPTDEIINKSIVVDLHAPYTELSKLELIIQDENENRDFFSEFVSNVPDDPLIGRN